MSVAMKLTVGAMITLGVINAGEVGVALADDPLGLARQWAVDGHGIVLKSIWDVSADLAAGRLTLLMPEWRTAEAPVHALYPRSRYQPPRVRALLEFLRDKFEQASAQMDI